MALTVRKLIKKLEKVEDKNAGVFIEFPADFLSVDSVILDSEGEVVLTNMIVSHHCLCDKCKTSETEL